MHPIRFPGLGLEFSIDRVGFSIFGLNVYWYGVIIASGFLLGTFLAMRSSKKFGIDSNDIINLLLFALPCAIIGARLYYVIFSWPNYQTNLLAIFNIHQGGLAIYGGVIAALVVIFIYARKRKISVLELFDFMVPYLALGQSIGRWGNFVNQEAFGSATSLPWRMEIYDSLTLQIVTVHPTFLYESLWDFALFLLLIWVRKHRKFNGEVITLYIAIYGLGRCLIEGLRTDSLYLGNFRASQILAAICFVVFISLFYVGLIKGEKKHDF